MAIKGLRPRATAHGGSVTPGQDRGAFPWTPQQQRVLDIVSDGEGVAVIGAPGSGKSALLIELAVRGWRTVEQGDSTEQGVLLPPVLTLTAERRSATLLRRRVAAALPATTSGTPARSTQALAFELLTAHAVATRGPLPELLTGAEQDSIIADLLLGHLDEAPNDVDGRGPEWPTWLAAPVRMLQVFRTELRDLLDRADAASINSRELADMGSRHRRPEWLAAAAFADDYHDVLQTYRTERFSATELVLRAAELVRRDGLPGVSLVLADDLQDWSRADLALLDALASTGTPVAVFGDPDLASNSFRGGAADALGSGGTRWGVSVETVVLDSVFRHGSQIRDAIADLSYSLGAAGAGRQRKALASPSVSGPSAVGNSTVGTSTIEGASLVSVTSADATGEVFAIARHLAEQHLLSDVAWSRMAVVVRSRVQVELMASRLVSQGVPTRTVASIVDVDDTAIGSDLLSVMRIASGAVPLDAELAARLLAGPLGGLDSVRLARLRSDLVTGEFVSGGTRSRSTLLVDALTSDDGLRDVRPDLARHARKLAGILRSATQAAESGADAEELLWVIWDGSGLAPGWQEQALLTGARADEANTNLDAVMALFTSARRFVEARPDSTVAVFLAEHDGSTVPVDSLGASVDVDRVLVCTPANVVGDSYEAVVVAGLQEGAWPNLAPRGTLLHATEFTELLDSQDGRAVRRSDAERRREVLDDELRLLILALSRAERIAVISAVSSDDAQPSRFFEHLALMAGTEIGPDDLGAAHHDLTHLVAALRAGLERRLATTTVSGEGVAEAPAEIPAEAIALARLAEAGIDAADPAKWYGMLPPSTDAPLAALGPDEQPFKVSPSTIEKFEKSPLIWFLDRVAPQYNGNSAAIGTMVHSVMENAGEDLSTAALWDALDERWSELEHDAEWLRERSRTEVRTMLTALSAYLVRFDRDAGELLGSEVPFTLDLGPVRLSGVIDRVESRKGKDGERRLQIVDLKTGARPASAAETVEHAQLSGYQLAAAEGLLGEAIDPDLTIGGASLLYIGSKNHTAGAPVSRDQPPLDADGVAGFTRRVRDVGAAMASGDFRVPVDLDERDPAAARVRSHLIPAASSAPVAPTERSGLVSADTASVSAEDPV